MSSTEARLAVDRPGIADYQFIRVLGTGNHGVFYLANRPERLRIDADLVAVKVLTGSNSQDTFRRATRELAAFAAVRSPYLVTLYDAGQQGDDLYYSMEYLPAGSLADAGDSVRPREALTAVAVACLTIYDMVKAVERGMRIENIRLIEKSGGRSGHFRE